MTAYYNEIDPKAAAWLRELIRRDLIAPGDVDERSIEDVKPDDLRPYTQCHFFAGIGVWSYALRRAGWPDSRPVWTGSCPCQPFSAAGKGGGFADERHLWPAWYHLIVERRPDEIFGEQVANGIGLTWLDLVQTDLEGAGYAVGSVDTCSAGFGAPHIRQRLRFAAQRMEHTASDRRVEWRAEPSGRGVVSGRSIGTLDHAASARHIGPLQDAESAARDDARMRLSGAGRGLGELVQPVSARLEGQPRHGHDGDQPGRGGAAAGGSITAPSAVDGLADADGRQCVGIADGERRVSDGTTSRRQQGDSQLGRSGQAGGTGPVNGFWRAADWLFCRDGKWRPVEPGTFPLVDGAAARVGRLRGYGNAIDAIATAEFIAAYLETNAALAEHEWD